MQLFSLIKKKKREKKKSQRRNLLVCVCVCVYWLNGDHNMPYTISLEWLKWKRFYQLVIYLYIVQHFRRKFSLKRK